MIRKQRSKRLSVLLIILLGAILQAHAAEYRHLQWPDLQTDADRSAMRNLPPINHGGAPQSAVDPLAGLSGQDEATIAQSLAKQQATAVLHSTTVRSELNGERIQLEGFIVPIEMNSSGAITEFFLVPYIGACIHVPPPPPNQIIYIRYSAGINADLINEVFRAEGTLHTTITSKSMGQAAYSMRADRVFVYEGANDI
jgi:hypothetical protein